jgi:hypothetical protein
MERDLMSIAAWAAAKHRLERNCHERASLISCVGEPLKRQR